MRDMKVCGKLPATIHRNTLLTKSPQQQKWHQFILPFYFYIHVYVYYFFLLMLEACTELATF